LRTADSPKYLWFNVPPGLSCTMGMVHALRSSAVSMRALRSTPPEDMCTSCGRAALYAPTCRGEVRGRGRVRVREGKGGCERVSSEGVRQPRVGEQLLPYSDAKVANLTLGFGAGRQRTLVDRGTNPTRSRRTCVYMRVRAIVVSSEIGGRRETPS
jgi:hypothetical protein